MKISYRWYLCDNYMFPKNDQVYSEATEKIKYKSQGVSQKYSNTAQTVSR